MWMFVSVQRSFSDIEMIEASQSDDMLSDFSHTSDNLPSRWGSFQSSQSVCNSNN